MLVEKNLKDKRKSWYICDMCGDKLTAIGRYLICVNNKKRWDLCRLCTKRVKAYIERGI